MTVLSAALICASTSAAAQKKAQTPENIATHRANEMKKQIGLTGKQYQKVYRLFLKEEELRKEQTGKDRRPQRPQGERPENGMRPEGGRPGGQGGFGPGHQGGRPPMGGRPGGAQGGRGPEMGGRPGGPGAGHGPEMSGPSKDPDSAEYIKKADKQLKKILSKEQYRKWRKLHPVELW